MEYENLPVHKMGALTLKSTVLEGGNYCRTSLNRTSPLFPLSSRPLRFGLN